MAMHWQELLPADQYKVSAAGLLHDYDRKVLTRLYQPLIGPVCISLYMTLWSEMEENRLWSEAFTHYQLMNTIGLNLKEIYNARVQLEGIGLLTVFKKEEGGSKELIYELNPPLSPQAFFTDGMLNIYLYKKVGKVHFGRLKKFFCDEEIPFSDFQNVTKSFVDVFSSEHIQSLYVTDEAEHEWNAEENQKFIDRTEALQPSGFEALFDFDLLFAGIKPSTIARKAFTPKVKGMISKLAFLYGINPLDMQKLVIDASIHRDEINEESLRKAARDWYQIERSVEMPSLINRVQPAVYRTQTEEPKTQEEQLIHHLETISPLQRFKQISGGAEPSEADLKIIENIMLHQNLNPGVVNVLMEYVMLKTDMRLPKNFIGKIASHWSRLKVKTVREAMDLAKKEHQKYQEWSEGNTAAGTRKTTKKSIRTEVVPDWFGKEETEKKETGVLDPSAAERKRSIEEQLKKLKAGGDLKHEKD
ncbi:replication initiation and membrane attachment family protein [Bacillus massiliglaciei]|uniref:replication initiation and membrane attachment family protein n=1 Tax=Bacillus massiliglaciei TaxID=1816693 RepID=UPI000B0CB585|nr:replication initiation and membrane attachment family protein [Bacillus massiliglaciei]